MAKEKQDGLHIVKATVKNFQNIDYKEVEFGGRSAMIIGKNGDGKSSLLRAICSPVNSKYTPLEPIKKGEERAEVELDIEGILSGEEKKYKVSAYYSPEKKQGRLVIEDEFGQKVPGGAQMLSTIIGDIGFDIMEFVRLGRTETGRISKDGVRKQIEILKQLMGKEAIRALYALDQEKDQIYAKRTEINRDVDFAEKKIKASEFTQEQIEKYSKPLDANELSEKIEKSRKHNENMDKAEQDWNDENARCLAIESQIIKLQEQLKEAGAKASSAGTWFREREKIDLSVLTNQMNEIGTHNANHAKIQEVEKMSTQLIEDKKKSDEITNRLKEIDAEKKKLFAESNLPIKGLTFDEESIMYNDLPLSDDSIPTSHLIGIGVKIGMAYNPNLRLLVIRDGSLLDKKTLDFILKICEEENYQILIEMVKFEGEGMDINFIERSE